ASQIVWLDAFITNVDRTFRNTNMLIWHKELWLIDHGASFYFHHSFTNWEKSALTPFSFIKDHALLPVAKELDIVDKEFKALLQEEDLKYITDQIPTDWLEWEESDLTPEEIRSIYFSFLKNRLANSDLFVNEAKKHQDAGI
ncbi:HipA family kinase, partial [Myroides marinus]|nr:aminotransferase class I and II [Myroides marinus]